MSIFQFVDAIGPAPTVRLDLNAGPLRVADEGVDLAPPPLRRATASTLLVDGAIIPATAWDNRTIKLTLQMVQPTPDDAATTLQLLARELVRDNNILRVQLGTAAYFFRTFAAPDYGFSMPKLLVQYGVAVLEIPAEPFAYGLKETLPSVTVSNDPAVGSTFDIAGVKGDVETPLVLRRTVTNRGAQSLFALRRRGTPANAPFLLQAEAMPQGADTTTQANSGAFSGAGNNYSRCTFGTISGMSLRVRTSAFPASASLDNRGTYRVFARLRKNGTTGTINIRAQYTFANSGVISDSQPVTWTSPALVEFTFGGQPLMVPIPVGADPVIDGVSGVQIPAGGIGIEIDAERLSGTDTLDIDYLLFVPADDRLAVVNWGTFLGTTDALVLDGVHEMSYGIILATGEIVSKSPGYHVGGLPMLSPGVTNRVYFINEVSPGQPEPAFPASFPFDLWYWPRYLYIRSAGS